MLDTPNTAIRNRYVHAVLEAPLPNADDPRWIAPYMLLMSAFQISDPIEAFIQMKINDLSRRALRLRIQYAACIYSTPFPLGVPNCIQSDCAILCRIMCH